MFFISKDMVVLVYVDGCILISKEEASIKPFVKSLENGPEKCVFTTEGTMESYLGVNIEQLPEKKGFVLSQTFPINRIIEALGFDLATKKKARDNTPCGYPLLSKDENGLLRKAKWKYRGVFGMLGYLQGTRFPDISMPTHQCTRLNNDPKLSHERAVN